MKIGLGRLVVAIVLFVVGAAYWIEARLTRRVAEARQELTTLRYDRAQGIDEVSAAIDRRLWHFGSIREEARQLRTQVSYWRAPGNPSTAEVEVAPAAIGPVDADRDAGADPDELFAAANRAFRAAQQLTGDRIAAVERIDRVVQSYAAVLRADSGNGDASFNYEYAARYRDTVARGRGPIQPVDPEAQEGERDVSDLPAGPTVHGRPGAPPPDVPAEEFKTLVPMPSEERPEDPGEGSGRRRG